MSNTYFQFKQFIIQQDKCAMKVTTDACLFGAWVADKIKNAVQTTCLDMGTGTGLLSCMLAQANNKMMIDAIEIDAAAFEQASENITTSPWRESINIIHGDIKKIELKKKYDIIVSNPPFYENEWKGGDAKRNIAHHNEGLLFSQLLSAIKKYLQPEGNFFLLIPFKRNEEIKKLMEENGFEFTAITFVSQSVHHDYFRVIIAGKIKQEIRVGTACNVLAIKNERNEYSSGFKSLLQPYYLYL